ncbi:hypothetical protein [Niabella drilacis]|uniref:Uncharacterized protein n=1 Tax=Niabella drilacis (strain DSM 25811 / CCM 8410 / CCUG 62505 / LMG 26954 / E90) TaxID=1285928 RepID=A0A1G7ADQ6_NIADE|nr:hypothetical protein [Niabella drilacis]SDE12890.1 hypothetical protein SAMN04487894_12256 [Niabella drilacis]
MKFRRGILLFIIGVVLVAYFTKPSKDGFIKFIQPAVSRTQIPPVVDYQDQFLYALVTATYIDAGNPVKEGGRIVAPTRKETYIGVFGRYWKQAP